MSMATMIDITARWDVRLMRFRSSWVTGRRVISERPRSPCTALVIQLRYWTRNGRSRPSSWRARDRISGVGAAAWSSRSEEHTSELQSLTNLVCRLLLEKKKKEQQVTNHTGGHD